MRIEQTRKKSEAFAAKSNYNDTAALATQASKAARRLGVTLVNHAEIAALLKGV